MLKVISRFWAGGKTERLQVMAPPPERTVLAGALPHSPVTALIIHRNNLLQPFMSASGTGRRELTVEALWHEQASVALYL